jgi:nucleoside-diphosphate-sugar epimerase
MKILFTGGSSFTGYWFIRELVAAGHEVVAIFRRKPDEYADSLRRQRVDAVSALSEAVFGPAFGDDHFLDLIKSSRWDMFCHHGADVTDYRSPHFDVTGAVANNTRGLPSVIECLMRQGCGQIVLTGSIFENDEGVGSRDCRAFSPYGLSKAFTWQLFRYHAEIRQLTLGKFVIPNPFGPYEEARFTRYLLKTWYAGETATVSTPAYVRDNIHVTLLAKAYHQFATALQAGVSVTNPSGYVESQGAFTARVASEMRARLKLACAFELKAQTEFPEPRIRVNMDQVDPKTANWDEVAAWDEFAEYYSSLLRGA